MSFDIGTIGKLKCEIALSKILKESNDDKLVRKIMSRFMEFKNCCKKIKDVNDRKLSIRLLRLYKESIQNNYPNEWKEIKAWSFLNCCMEAHYHETIKIINEVIEQ